MNAYVDFRRRLMLADGGVYDNMGLETVWGYDATALVGDGGKPFELDAKRSGSFAQLACVADIGLNQALVLRKRKVVPAFKQKRCRGAYGGIGTQVADYGLGEDALNIAPAKAAEVAWQGRVRHLTLSTRPVKSAAAG